jgi:polysaccharide pyruvyl transferase WcaK-like protein
MASIELCFGFDEEVKQTLVKVLIIHVGSMNNKGTQALLKSDFSLIRSVLGKDVVISVSTTDVPGVKRIFSLRDVFSPAIDIPFEFADSFAKRLRFSRDSPRYKIIALMCLALIPLEMSFSVLSAIFAKVGLEPFYRKEFFKSLKESDFVVSCSDENFKEGVSLLPSNFYWTLTWWTLLFARTWDVMIVKFFGKHLIMFPNSVGPFRSAVGRFLARLAVGRCDCVLVRESRSCKTMDSIGISVPRILTSDIALLFNSGENAAIADDRHPVVGVCLGVYSHTLSEEQIGKFVELSSKVLDKAIARHQFSLVFMPHYVSNFKFDDLQISELVLEKMKEKDRCKILNMSNVEEFKTRIGKMDMIISSKMHPAVLAVASYVPTVCIAYDDKQLGFFEQLDLADCVIPVNKVTEQTLDKIIDHIWSRQGEIVSILKERIPAAKENIRTSARKVLEYFSKSIGDKTD